MKKVSLVLLVFFLFFNALAQNTNSLITGEPLKVNTKLISDNGDYYLIVETDGNLCLHGPSGVYWCAMSQNSIGGGLLVLQKDGNLVVKNKEGGTNWASKTHPYFDSKFKYGNKPKKLALENDGTLALYNKKGKEVWRANIDSFDKNTLTSDEYLKEISAAEDKNTVTVEPSNAEVVNKENHSNIKVKIKDGIVSVNREPYVKLVEKNYKDFYIQNLDGKELLLATRGSTIVPRYDATLRKNVDETTYYYMVRFTESGAEAKVIEYKEGVFKSLNKKGVIKTLFKNDVIIADEIDSVAESRYTRLIYNRNVVNSN
ncbi:hypothetical protein OAD62_03550 [Oceanihabitans sp.]|nr:hypothetical protein [Oceanihabitans sp.]